MSLGKFESVPILAFRPDHFGEPKEGIDANKAERGSLEKTVSSLEENFAKTQLQENNAIEQCKAGETNKKTTVMEKNGETTKKIHFHRTDRKRPAEMAMRWSFP